MRLQYAVDTTLPKLRTFRSEIRQLEFDESDGIERWSPEPPPVSSGHSLQATLQRTVKVVELKSSAPPVVVSGRASRGSSQTVTTVTRRDGRAMTATATTVSTGHYGLERADSVGLQLSLADVVRLGLYSGSGGGRIVEPISRERMTLSEALRHRLVSAAAGQLTAAGDGLTVTEAIQRAAIASDTAATVDATTGRQVALDEAVRRGAVRPPRALLGAVLDGDRDLLRSVDPDRRCLLEAGSERLWSVAEALAGGVLDASGRFGGAPLAEAVNRGRCQLVETQTALGVRGMRDTITGDWLTLPEAVVRGYFDCDARRYVDKRTGRALALATADADMVTDELVALLGGPSGLRDAAGRPVTMLAAVQQRLVHLESGDVTDATSGRRLTLDAAVTAGVLTADDALRILQLTSPLIQHTTFVTELHPVGVKLNERTTFVTELHPVGVKSEGRTTFVTELHPVGVKSEGRTTCVTESGVVDAKRSRSNESVSEVTSSERRLVSGAPTTLTTLTAVESGGQSMRTEEFDSTRTAIPGGERTVEELHRSEYRSQRTADGFVSSAVSEDRVRKSSMTEQADISGSPAMLTDGGGGRTSPPAAKYYTIQSAVDPTTGEMVGVAYAIQHGVIDQANGEYVGVKDGVACRMAISEAVAAGLVTAEVTEVTDAIVTSGSKFVEVKRKFAIRSVTDPESGRRLSVGEAVARGIVDQARGLYVNPATRDTMLLTEAIQRHLVEGDETTVTGEGGGGAVGASITTSTETTYTLVAVVDPASGAEMSPEAAIRAGVLDPRTGEYHGGSGGTLTVAAAVERGLMRVTAGRVPVPEVGEGEEGKRDSLHIEDDDSQTDEMGIEELSEEQSTFQITGVLDAASGEVVSYADAMRVGLVDEVAGVYVDSVTGERTAISEALSRGVIQGELVAQRHNTQLLVSSVETGGGGPTAPVIHAVMNPVSGRAVGVEHAVKLRLLSADHTTYHDAAGGRDMTAAQAIRAGFINPTAEALARAGPHGDAERKGTGKRRGVIDWSAGCVRDSGSGEVVELGDAVQRGWVNESTALLLSRKTETMPFRGLTNAPGGSGVETRRTPHVSQSSPGVMVSAGRDDITDDDGSGGGHKTTLEIEMTQLIQCIPSAVTVEDRQVSAAELPSTMTLDNALQMALFSPASNRFYEPATGETMTLQQAIDRRCVDVDGTALVSVGDGRQVSLRQAMTMNLVSASTGSVDVRVARMEKVVLDPLLSKVTIAPPALNLLDVVAVGLWRPLVGRVADPSTGALSTLSDSIASGVVHGRSVLVTDPATGRRLCLDAAVATGVIDGGSGELSAGRLTLCDAVRAGLVESVYQPDSGKVLDAETGRLTSLLAAVTAGGVALDDVRLYSAVNRRRAAVKRPEQVPHDAARASANRTLAVRGQPVLDHRAQRMMHTGRLHASETVTRTEERVRNGVAGQQGALLEVARQGALVGAEVKSLDISQRDTPVTVTMEDGVVSARCGNTLVVEKNVYRESQQEAVATPMAVAAITADDAASPAATEYHGGKESTGGAISAEQFHPGVRTPPPLSPLPQPEMVVIPEPAVMPPATVRLERATAHPGMSVRECDVTDRPEVNAVEVEMVMPVGGVREREEEEEEMARYTVTGRVGERAVGSYTVQSTRSAVEHRAEPVRAPVAQREPAPMAQREPAPLVQREPTPVVQREPAPMVQREPAPMVQREPAPMVQREPAPMVQREPPPTSTPMSTLTFVSSVETRPPPATPTVDVYRPSDVAYDTSPRRPVVVTTTTSTTEEETRTEANIDWTTGEVTDGRTGDRLSARQAQQRGLIDSHIAQLVSAARRRHLAARDGDEPPVTTLNDAASRGLLIVPLGRITHPVTSQRMTIEEAIDIGFLDASRSVVLEPTTREPLVLEDVIARGLLDPHSGEWHGNGKTMSLTEMSLAGLIPPHGLDRQEAPPVAETAVATYRDARSEERDVVSTTDGRRRGISFEVAMEQGLVDLLENTFTVPGSGGVTMPLDVALRDGHLYGPPDGLSVTVAARQRTEETVRSRKRVTFADAVHRNWVDLDRSEFIDPAEGARTPIADAILNNRINAEGPRSAEGASVNLLEAVDRRLFVDGRYRDGGRRLSLSGAIEAGFISGDTVYYDTRRARLFTLQQGLDDGIVDPATGHHRGVDGDGCDFREAVQRALVAVVGTPLLSSAVISASLLRGRRSRSAESRSESRPESESTVYKTFVESADVERIAGRPILGVVDPRTGQTLTVATAVVAGLFDREAGHYRHPTTGKVLTLAEAVRLGFVLTDSPAAAPDNVHYRILAVLDTRAGRFVEAAAAIEGGLLDMAARTCVDTADGRVIALVSALERGMLKVEIGEDGEEEGELMQVRGHTHTRNTRKRNNYKMYQ